MQTEVLELTAVEIPEFLPVIKQSGLDKAELHAATFAPFMVTLKELTDKAANINHNEPTALDAKLAREVRLAIVKNRTASEKVKNDNKAALLAEGNLIQNFYNIIANTSKLSETDLEAVEKFAENKEKERKAKLAIERAEMFTEYGTDLTGYDLGNMADNVFADLLESQKLLHEKRIADAAKIEAERIAAEKAELERQAALKAENERLKKEAEAAAAILEAERKEAARLAKIEQDKADALAKENADELAAIDAELKATQEAAAKAQAELKAKQDAENKAAADKLAAEKKAAKAPVKTKLKTAVSELSLQLPESEITSEIIAKFNGFKNWALQQIESL